MIEAEEGPLPILQIVIAAEDTFSVARALGDIQRSNDSVLNKLAKAPHVYTNYLWQRDRWMLMGKTVVVMSEMPS